MDYTDESYVRLYVRDTKTWLRLGFEGQCVLTFVMRKMDKAGVLDGIDDASDVALLTGMPLGIVEVGLPRVLERGVFELHGDKLVMPNYIKGQTAVRNDNARQRDMRERRAAEARLVTPRDADVTRRDKISRDTTDGHAPSRNVTLYSASLCSADLHSAVLDPPVAPQGTKRRKPERKVETAIPDDWEPTDAHRAFCLKHRLNLDLEVTGFKGWAEGRKALSWNGTFTTRLTNSVKWAKPQAPPSQTGRVIDRITFLREQEAADEALRNGTQ